MKKLLSILTALLFLNSSVAFCSYSPKNDNGQETMANSEPVVIASDQSAVPVSGTFWQATQPVSGTVTANAGTNLNTSALALESGGNLATIAGKDFATQTTLAAINAKLVTGTDIGDVTINNASGGSAVNIQDGGNIITVDGTVTADTELPTAATLADTTSNPTIPSVGAMPHLFNGTTWDRAKSPTADSVAATGIAASALMGYDGATWNRIRAGLGDAVASAAGILAPTTMLYNGTTYDRRRSASGDSLSGTGMAASGNMIWDGSSSWNRWRNAATDAITTAGVPYVSLAVYSGSNFSKAHAATADGKSNSNILFAAAGINNGTTIDRWKNPTGDAAAVTGYGGVVQIGYNGSTFDRVRSGPAADALSVTGYLGSANLAWNNTGWDRVRIPSGDGMAVTGFLGKVGMLFNGSTFDRWRSIINATNSTGLGIVAAGIIAQFDDVSPTSITENQFGNLRMSANRNLFGTIRDAAGNERGTNVNSSNQLSVNAGAFTSGGASYFKSIDLDETEEQVKATAGQLYGGIVMNLTASVLFLKIYNATAASVIVGTTVPDLTIPIPTAGSTNGAGFIIPIPATGVEFTTAITTACTTGIADADSGAPAANACVVTLFYK